MKLCLLPEDTLKGPPPSWKGEHQSLVGAKAMRVHKGLKRKKLVSHWSAGLCLVAYSCLTLLPHGLYPPSSSVHGILQARTLWVAIPFSRESSWPRDQTWVSCTAGRLPSEPPRKPRLEKQKANHKRKSTGNSLAVQWLGLGAFTAWPWVQSLVWELISCKPCSIAKKKKKKT